MPLLSGIVKICRLLFLVLLSAANAQTDGTALGAIKLLPKDSVKALARIEARGGTPSPERWYLLVYDAAAPNALREFVVADGRIVANRTLSQFADGLKKTDMLGGDSVKINSDQASRLAAAFAAENGRQVGSLDYQLERSSQEPGSIWRITVLDSAGDQLGTLVVLAGSGRIVSHDGFEKQPPPEALSAAIGLARVAAPARAVTAPRKAVPDATPKPGFLKRIFGSNEAKPKPAPR